MVLATADPDTARSPRSALRAQLLPEPMARADLGISPSLLFDIVLRRTMLDGRTSTYELAQRIAVSPLVMEEVVEELRALHLVELHGLERRNMLFSLTEQGRQQAMERMSLCRYVGPAPVSLESYRAVVTAQHRRPAIHHDTIREAFSDLVVSDRLLDELGPAVRSEGAIFLYGPPGTGKSSLAERLVRVHGDHVLIPHAVEVDGQVITVFDPVVHRPVDPQPQHHDARWVLCERPSVIVGGELTASQLDVTFESHGGIYVAPLQMQANNGILVIDDFGRQTLTPEQLLNRWIVPLDRGIDYLTLEYGVKFEIPCLTKIVFSTNLEPSQLADEAFFRRIRSKVLIPSIEDDAFDEVLRRVAAARGVEVTPDAFEALRRASRELGDGDLRPYLPGAVCELVQAVTDYEDLPARLDQAMVERVTRLFFTHDRAMKGS